MFVHLHGHVTMVKGETMHLEGRWAGMKEDRSQEREEEVV